MSRLDEFLHEHRVVPGCGHWIEGGGGHDPLVRALHRVYKAWCEANEYLILSEDKFVPLVVDAGHEKFKSVEGQRFKGLTLDTAVEHAGGAADPEAYWAEQIELRRAEHEAEKVADAEEAAARAAKLAADAAYRKASEWWSRMAYQHLASGYALPPEVEAHREKFFRQEKLDRAQREHFVRERGTAASHAAQAAYDAKHGGHGVRNGEDYVPDWQQAGGDAYAYAAAMAADKWDREHPDAIARLAAEGSPVRGGMADYVDGQLARWRQRRQARINDEIGSLARGRGLGVSMQKDTRGKLRPKGYSIFNLTASEREALEAEAAPIVEARLDVFAHDEESCYFAHGPLGEDPTPAMVKSGEV